MRKFNFLLSIILLITFTSCEIVQETNFEEDGSGVYSLGFNLNELSKMDGGKTKGEIKTIDTLMVFSDFLKEKKDSISKLSIEKQRELKELENFSFYFKSDAATKDFKMKLIYNFKDISDIQTIGEKLKNKNIKELNLLGNPKADEEDTNNKLFDLAKSYDTKFSRKYFSNKITPEAIKELESKKDTTLTKDIPISDLIKIKMIYHFPYKIKKVRGENAKILPDFKGVEITGNLFDTNNDSHFYDVDVEFE